MKDADGTLLPPLLGGISLTLLGYIKYREKDMHQAGVAILIPSQLILANKKMSLIFCHFRGRVANRSMTQECGFTRLIICVGFD